MAQAKASRPGLALIILVVVLVGMFAAVAAIGTWKPKLGLDLQGGQRITLQASTTNGGSVTPAKLDEAVGIISNRVNGAGVAEAEVSTQGSDIIVVEIPGKPEEDLARSIGSTAQLRFRLVAEQIGPAAAANQTPTDENPTAPAETGPTDGGATSGGATSDAPSDAPSSDAPSDVTGSANERPAARWMRAGTTSPAAGGSSTAADGSGDNAPETTGAPEEPTNPTPEGPPPALVPPQLEQIPDPYAWISQFRAGTPPADWQSRLVAFDCDNPQPGAAGQIDIPDQPLLACDDQGNRYLLGPSMVDGTDVTDASAGIPQGGVNYVVDLSFNGQGADKFGEVTTKIAKNGGDPSLAGAQLAIVLDGEVLSAPTNDDPILGGQAQISGGTGNPFTQDEANNLANSLKYGALPLTFEIVNTSNEGPELASNQLEAGIVAGIVGLLLVVIYCMFYYRGLSVVIIASLLVAGLATYASVLLLSHAYGFTLTLPGIAGLIVAIGITADSFIVYFERLRDEVRDGRTLRTSVETGWVRARSTILAADAVSFLAAVVLFIFAIGVVKGFAFALGLSTVIDVAIVFLFTKPMVTLLARTKFFGNGHKWSGLDRQHLGLPPLPPPSSTPATARRRPRPSGGEA